MFVKSQSTVLQSAGDASRWTLHARSTASPPGEEFARELAPQARRVEVDMQTCASDH